MLTLALCAPHHRRPRDAFSASTVENPDHQPTNQLLCFDFKYRRISTQATFVPRGPSGCYKPCSVLFTSARIIRLISRLIGSPSTATSTLTQLLRSLPNPSLVQCCFTSTETVLRTIRDSESRTATSTFTQPLCSVHHSPNPIAHSLTDLFSPPCVADQRRQAGCLLPRRGQRA